MTPLLRTYHKRLTTGRLIMPDGSELRALERPWLDNKSNISCIPEGQYIVDRDYHGKWKYYRIRDEQVSPRFAIELHPATFVSHLAGCIAPCMSLQNEVPVEGKEVVAMDGGIAMEKLLDWFGDDSWAIDIREDK